MRECSCVPPALFLSAAGVGVMWDLLEMQFLLSLPDTDPGVRGEAGTWQVTDAEQDFSALTLLGFCSGPLCLYVHPWAWECTCLLYVHVCTRCVCDCPGVTEC